YTLSLHDALPISPPPFWKSVIPWDFKSNDFVRAHSKGLMGAFFVSAHPKGVTRFREHQSIAPPESREALTAAALSLVCSFQVAHSSHSWTQVGIKPGDSSILRARC